MATLSTPVKGPMVLCILLQMFKGRTCAGLFAL